ncbi:MAG: 50S ribosomal protein L29 [Candidatus Nealsonbacteria bacterium DGGOD1a]|jgi:ribosomal protein L29|nr:MAG: 50S ribosomal protein L29 [Candidatus Nealsonbacteria bacterium DGGOD1a]
MKTSELRQKNKQELAVILDEKLAKLAELRFDLSAGKVKNLKEVRQIKLDVARIKTLQNETIEN